MRILIYTTVFYFRGVRVKIRHMETELFNMKNLTEPQTQNAHFVLYYANKKGKVLHSYATEYLKPVRHGQGHFSRVAAECLKQVDGQSSSVSINYIGQDACS